MAKKARVIKADYLLKDKIGSDPVNENTIEKCQNILDSNPFDFLPIAKEQLERLYDAIEKAKKNDLTRDEATQLMIECVMQIKANAPLFNYELVGRLANIMLSFLETISEIDDHAVEIVSAHHNTLHAIIAKNMKGDGGPIGKQFETELESACSRYFNKQK